VPRVTWKRQLNEGLKRATGLEVRRAAEPKPAAKRKPKPKARLRKGDRLVEAPVFVMCTLRSGSTLLRVLLDSHSQIHAPHELHLRKVNVQFGDKWAAKAMKEMRLDERALEHLLWDRILHRELSDSGKSIIVDKTPNNVFSADRLLEAWPDARFIHLLRHPAAIVRSRQKYKGDDHDEAESIRTIQRYCEALERSRATHPGHTVRYEELTADPAGVMTGVCEFLGVPFEPTMLEYGEQDHGRYKVGLGDWVGKIQSGSIQAAEPPPEDTPEPLRAVAEAWGYAAPVSAPDASR
jgi:hypothetical protein